MNKLHQFTGYHKNWPAHRLAKYKVDLEHTERGYTSAPNEETKQLLEDRVHFFTKLIRGFNYLSDSAKTEDENA